MHKYRSRRGGWPTARWASRRWRRGSRPRRQSARSSPPLCGTPSCTPSGRPTWPACAPSRPRRSSPSSCSRAARESGTPSAGPSRPPRASACCPSCPSGRSSRRSQRAARASPARRSRPRSEPRVGSACRARSARLRPLVVRAPLLRFPTGRPASVAFRPSPKRVFRGS